MIYADNNKIMISGEGLEVASQLAAVIRDMAASLKRQGGTEEYVRSFFHHLVDVSLAAPPPDVAIDASYKKEG